MRMHIGVCYLLLGVLLSLLIGCSGEAGYDGEEREASRFGPIIIGPAEGYHTHIERDRGEGRDGDEHGDGEHRGGDRDGEGGDGEHRDGDRDREGGDPDPAPGVTAANVQVTGHRVRPTAGPVIDQFDLSLRNVQYQRSPFHIASVDSYAFTAQLRDTDISTYVNRRPRTGNLGMRDFRMTFSPQQVQTTSIIMLNNRALQVASTGVLRPEGDTRIIYVPSTFTADNAPLSLDVQQALLAQINPVADFGSLNCAPRVQQITLDRDQATISGTAMLQHLP